MLKSKRLSKDSERGETAGVVLVDGYLADFVATGYFIQLKQGNKVYQNEVEAEECILLLDWSDRLRIGTESVLLSIG
ncbi:hypothetical protein AAC387_Pa07g1875 [Persea americana]